MRVVSNMKNKELLKDQFNVFCDLISGIRDKEDLELFFKNFLTESEIAYLSQRLNVMRMLSKNFTYFDIYQKIKVPKGTISKSRAALEGDENFAKIISNYKYKEIKITNRGDFVNKKESFIKANYPGAIKID